MTTQLERLTRIETLIMTAEKQRTEDRADLTKTLDEMAADIKTIREDFDADKADLAALKNRGTGILIGVSLAAGALGAYAEKLIDRLFGA
jgi:DNA-binding protein H-NS